MKTNLRSFLGRFPVRGGKHLLSLLALGAAATLAQASYLPPTFPGGQKSGGLAGKSSFIDGGEAKPGDVGGFALGLTQALWRQDPASWVGNPFTQGSSSDQGPQRDMAAAASEPPGQGYPIPDSKTLKVGGLAREAEETFRSTNFEQEIGDDLFILDNAGHGDPEDRSAGDRTEKYDHGRGAHGTPAPSGLVLGTVGAVCLLLPWACWRRKRRAMGQRAR
jgi:hypothetical protein